MDVNLVAAVSRRHIDDLTAELAPHFHADPNGMCALEFGCFTYGTENVDLPVASAEDILLSKLAWYRAGGEVSERRWNDVLGIAAVQGERLDTVYLRKWAQYLKVADLLELALRHAK